jgi:very-short-patch-repair endonuclease
VVEVDGYAFHSSRSSFERDRRKDLELSAAGYRVLRVTRRQINEEPEALVATLAAALAA